MFPSKTICRERWKDSDLFPLVKWYKCLKMLPGKWPSAIFPVLHWFLFSVRLVLFSLCAFISIISFAWTCTCGLLGTIELFNTITIKSRRQNKIRHIFRSRVLSNCLLQIYAAVALFRFKVTSEKKSANILHILESKYSFHIKFVCQGRILIILR